VALLAVVGVFTSGWLWIKIDHIQEQLARQSADTGNQAVEAKLSAKQAQELARDTAAQLSVMQAKISEVSLQRSQLEDLMQSLSHSRDENLVVDIDSAIRLALQQSQLTGSVQPLLAALKSSQTRLEKVAQPRLAPVLRAIVRDTDRIKAASVTDTPGLLIKVDELVRTLETLPLLNDVGEVTAPMPPAPQPEAGWVKAISLNAWQGAVQQVWNQFRQLLRISRIDTPEASLLSPQQSYFVRENLKLRLLNARLGLLSRQYDVARSDLTLVNQDLKKYFDTTSRQGKIALDLAREVMEQSKQTELPRVDETLTALSTAAAGR
jgi:uroporphyrin-3 C-methyltransferase